MEALTEEQIAKLPAIRDKWMAIGLNTQPADRAKAEEGVRLAYEIAGLEVPKDFYWVQSPWEGVQKQAELRAGSNDPKKMKSFLGDWWQGLLGGNLWAGWLSWRYAYADLGHPELCKELNGLVKVAENAGWWWAFDEAVILTERASTLKLDPQNRLHSEVGNAIEWPDGEGIPVWHGTQLPATPEEILGWSIEEILAHSNTEVRRCAIEIRGWDNFVKESNFTAVDSADDPGNPAQKLELYDIPRQIFDVDIRVLLCTNGSPERDGRRRRFGLTVPATCKTAVEAAAWTYGLDEKDYAVTRRT